jgi:hypothetical protein
LPDLALGGRIRALQARLAARTSGQGMPVDSSRSGIFRNLDLAVAISARLAAGPALTP